MAIKEMKKLGTYKDGEHDWIVSTVEINGTKTVGIRRWKTRGEGYIGPTKMGINIPPQFLQKMIADGSLEKAIKEIMPVEEEKKSKKKSTTKKKSSTSKKSSKKEAEAEE